DAARPRSAALRVVSARRLRDEDGEHDAGRAGQRPRALPGPAARPYRVAQRCWWTTRARAMAACVLRGAGWTSIERGVYRRDGLTGLLRATCLWRLRNALSISSYEKLALRPLGFGSTQTVVPPICRALRPVTTIFSSGNSARYTMMPTAATMR